MIISDFAIKKPIVTVVCMLAIVVFGIFGVANTNTDEFPNIEQPLVVVSLFYPCASPAGVEREVIDPIEESVSGISGIDKINSSSGDGFASMVIFFKFGKDINQASQE